MNSAYFWLAVGLVLMIAEVVTPGFILFFFGLAAVLVGYLTLATLVKRLFMHRYGTWL